jgi:hypothetical protein
MASLFNVGRTDRLSRLLLGVGLGVPMRIGKMRGLTSWMGRL